MNLALGILFLMVGIAISGAIGWYFHKLARQAQPDKTWYRNFWAFWGTWVSLCCFLTTSVPFAITEALLICCALMLLRREAKAARSAAQEQSQPKPEPTPEMGWHPNPDTDDGSYRFHDGKQWTDMTIPHLGPPK